MNHNVFPKCTPTNVTICLHIQSKIIQNKRKCVVDAQISIEILMQETSSRAEKLVIMVEGK